MLWLTVQIGWCLATWYCISWPSPFVNWVRIVWGCLRVTCKQSANWDAVDLCTSTCTANGMECFLGSEWCGRWVSQECTVEHSDGALTECNWVRTTTVAYTQRTLHPSFPIFSVYVASGTSWLAGTCVSCWYVWLVCLDWVSSFIPRHCVCIPY